MAELRAALAPQESATARADAQAAQQDARQAEALAWELRQLATRLASPARERLRGLAAECAIAEQAVEVAAAAAAVAHRLDLQTRHHHLDRVDAAVG